MSDDFKKQIAIITGGSRGIGKAIAESLSQKGIVCILLARDYDALNEVSGLIKSRGGEAEFYNVDITDYKRVNEVIDDIKMRHNRIDVLINNAGVGLFKQVVEMSMEEWRKVMSVNLDAVFYMTRQVLPVMLSQGKGIIINIASLAGKNSFIGGSVYCASKAGLMAFSECLMLEVRDKNIKVGVIAPGSVATEFSDKADESWMLVAQDIAMQVVNMIEARDKANVSYVEIRPLKPIK